MQTYAAHKLMALGLIAFAIIFSSILSSTSTAGWYALLLLVTIFGYAHYVVGGVYQLRAYVHKPKPIKWFLWFLLLSVLSVGIAGAFAFTGMIGLLSFVVIGYFMLHGFFNEVTIYERQTHESANRYSVIALSALLFGVVMSAIGHASWFFTPDLAFVAMNSEALQQYITSDPLPLLARLGAVVSFAVALYAAYKARVTAVKYFSWHRAFIVMCAAGAVVSVAWYPLHYLYLLAALLLYHFIIWFLLYGELFIRVKRKELPLYVGLHLLVAVPFLALLFPSSTVGIVVDTYLLNSYTFLTATLVHITVSFLNEPWAKKYLE